jgi:hypothetical protein
MMTGWRQSRVSTETWTVTVTDGRGGIRYAVEVDIEPERSDTIDGPVAIIAAYNQLGGDPFGQAG